MAAGQWIRVGFAASLLALAVGRLSLAPASAGTTPCEPQLMQCGSGECFGQPFQLCRSTPDGCACVPAGCCQGDDKGPFCFNSTQSECKGEFILDTFCQFASGMCAPTRTPSSTPTHTPTVTQTQTATHTQTPTTTATKVPNGGECMTPSECASGICADGICQGTTAGVPAASPTGLLVGVIVLIGLGGIALLRRLRRSG